MADDFTDSIGATKPVQHLDSVPGADHQGQAALCEVVAQGGKRACDERPLPARCIGQAPILRFGNIDRQNPSTRGGKGQRRVIFGAQVALHPDKNIHGTFIGWPGDESKDVAESRVAKSEDREPPPVMTCRVINLSYKY